MSKIILDTFRKVLKNQNMYVEESPSLLYTFLSSILSFLQGYNHQKYFYRFMNDGNVKWRKLLYAMNLQLIKKISSSTTVHHDKPVCLIIDDTDAPKTGMTTELIG